MNMNTMNANRRVMTSAIDGMSVADVRKCLGEVRKQWTQQTVDHPFFSTDKLSNGMMIQEFSLRFQKGHHQKRHRLGHGKNNKKSHNLNEDDGTSSSDEDIYGFDSDNSPNSDNESKSAKNNNSNNNNNFSTTKHSASSITTPVATIDSNQTSNILSSLARYIPEMNLNNDPIEDKPTTISTNETNSLSSVLSNVTNKKRGRPKKKVAPISATQRGSHSRSLLEFVRKPEVKKIVSVKNKK